MKKLLIANLMIAVFVAFCYGQADYKINGTIKDSKGKGKTKKMEDQLFLKQIKMVNMNMHLFLMQNIH
jgi:hypothetical protein